MQSLYFLGSYNAGPLAIFLHTVVISAGAFSLDQLAAWWAAGKVGEKSPLPYDAYKFFK